MKIFLILLALACFILGVWLFRRYSNVSLSQQKNLSQILKLRQTNKQSETSKPLQTNRLSEASKLPQTNRLPETLKPPRTNRLPETSKPPQRLKRVPPDKKGHQENIEITTSVLKQIRSNPDKQELPYIIGTLRKITPYVFEELLLSCCQDQGWQIQRNNAYSGDGGVDGRTWILGEFYLIQAKCYEEYISAQHVYDFQKVIQQHEAKGGFFIHSGRTGPKSREALNQNPQIILISGQKLVNFVLGKKLKIVGITF